MILYGHQRVGLEGQRRMVQKVRRRIRRRLRLHHRMRVRHRHGNLGLLDGNGQSQPLRSGGEYLEFSEKQR